MHLRRLTMAALGASVLCACQPARAGTKTHASLSDFQTGISDGVVQAMQPTFNGTPPAGAVGLMPGLGASVIADEFNYTTMAAASANYLFLMENTADHADTLTANPSQFLFSGDTPTTPQAAAPAAGTLRIHASRQQDFFNTALVGQRSPLMVMNKNIVTGDFIAETKITIQQPRNTEDTRFDGLFIAAPTGDDGAGHATDLTLDSNTLYFVDGPIEAGVNSLGTDARIDAADGPFPSDFVNGTFPGQTWYVRVIKRGSYFYSYMKNSDTGPWVFQQWLKSPELAAAPGLVIGVFAKSWADVNATALQYQDDDFDYLHVNRVGTLAGSFTNVFDAGTSADWQTVSLNTDYKEGLKYQLRTGNTLAAGTLTDAGSFIGPDGTSATYYTDDAAQVVANPDGKRYLEYKILMDASAPPTATDIVPVQNLPPFLRNISASYEPAGVSAKILSTAADFGADAGGVQTQSGGGDISLAGTQVFRDDFTSTTLDSGWIFDPGGNVTDPTVAGDYSLTDRPGYLRMKVGYPQDFYDSTNKLGGVKLLRNLPSGIDSNNFEIEAEVNLENQQCREADLIMMEGQNDYMGIAVGRRFENVYDIGVLEDDVLNNVAVGPIITNYGSNTLQLRVTKQGTVITTAFRDPDSASPSWRVLAIRNTAGAATGLADFAPTQIGLMGKSYGYADESTQNYDYNYFSVSSLASTGQKDVTVTLPASSHPDALLAFGDGLTATDARAQVKNSGGTFVGPDGTSSTFFTVNEPKIPAALDGLTASAIRLFLGDSPATGTAYVHAAGISYATGSSRVARDTNAADFTAGAVKNGVDTTTIPGVVTPTIATGTSLTENFTSAPTGWTFSNNPPATSTFDYSGGQAELNAASPTDTWAPGASATKPRIVLYRTTPVAGDFELETYITFGSPRQVDRHRGLMIAQAQPGIDPTVNPDTALNLENVVMFGPYRDDSIRILHGDNNIFADGGPTGYTDSAYYLRLRKVGNVFTGYVSTDGVTYTQVISYTFSHDMGSMYVGFLSKAYNMSSGIETEDFDYFKFTPLSATGSFESRVLDLGAAGLTLFADSLGGNSASVQLQYRAAASTAALSSAAYVGPDGTAATSYAGDFSGLLTGLSGRYVQYKATIPPGTQLNDVAVVGSAVVTAPLSRADAVTALRIAGGLQAATASDVTRLDLVKGTSAGHIDVTDAARILRSVNGL